MQNPNIDALNDVIKTLIDSQQGYQKVCEMSDDSYALRSKFQSLANERTALINDFQTQVRAYGGEPQTSGGVAGSMHRAWADFTSMFRDDEKAALEAVDTGEEHLAKEIDDKLENTELDAQARELLRRAKSSACYGENFADQLS
ncbi:ferritin-like domain-containing protein [Henriciella litoralis]|uniref:ferritin-like domain-containing protein n=1 Tax=Henriciella litoralis TaxID=568102 RepID=UPI000A04EC3B|nr:PA2169 family four-helix-bundle protein [Henriciella litoralis]